MSDEVRQSRGLSKADRKRCKQCKFHGSLGQWVICDWILITDHTRPCKAGTDCTVFEKGPPIKPASDGGKDITIKKKNDAKKPPESIPSEPKRQYNRLDESQAMKLHRQGMMDTEIANTLGVNIWTVGYWRRRMGLAKNARKKYPGRERSVPVEGCPIGSEEWVRFGSVSAAAKYVGGDVGSISAICRGRGLSHKRWKWRYAQK